MAFDEEYLKVKFGKLDEITKRTSESVIRIEENINAIKQRLEDTEDIHSEQTNIMKELSSVSTNLQLYNKDVTHMAERFEARIAAAEERQLSDRQIFEERQAVTGKRIEALTEKVDALEHKPAEEVYAQNKSDKAAFRNAIICGIAGLLLGIAVTLISRYLVV